MIITGKVITKMEPTMKIGSILRYFLQDRLPIEYLLEVKLFRVRYIGFCLGIVRL